MKEKKPKDPVRVNVFCSHSRATRAFFSDNLICKLCGREWTQWDDPVPETVIGYFYLLDSKDKTK